MRSPSNRFGRAMDLRAEFRGVVPDDLLERFANAVESSSSFETKGPLAHDQLDRVFIYAQEPCGDEDLLFAPLTDAMFYAEEFELRHAVRTFGEFFDGIPGGMGAVYRDELAQLCEYPTYEEYARANPDDLDENDGKALNAAWKKLDPYWSRPPFDEEEFDAIRWFDMTFDRGWQWYDLKAEIYGTVPGPIVRSTALPLGAFTMAPTSSSSGATGKSSSRTSKLWAT